MTRSRVRRGFALLTLAFAAGCGSSTATTSGATDAAPTAPAVADDASPAAHAHHGRHRRHRHARDGEGGTPVAAAPDALGAPSGTAAGGAPCDDAKFLAIQAQFASGALEGDQEVDVCGTVTSVLASRTTRSGLHGYYYLQVTAGSTIEIVSDLGQMDAPAWPWVRTGDTSTVRGRYYYDSGSSQGIDWTHHGTSRSWPTAGYVVVDGTRYE